MNTLALSNYMNMRWIKYLILISHSLFIAHAFSQEWVRTYTSTNGLGYNARWVIESYDKGYVILGTAYNYKYGLILKTDINGELLWTKLLGNGNYHNVPINIEQSLDSGYIVSGTMSKYGSKDAYLLKLNSCFEKEWCKVLHTTNQYDDYGRMVKPLPDGGFLLLTAYYENISPGTRIHLHRFDPNGELIWQSAFAQSDSLIFGEEGFDLTIINENEYLITGDCYYPDSGQTVGWIRPFLIKTNSMGNVVWETVWGKDDYYYGTSGSSIVDNQGSIFSIGMHITENGQFPSFVCTDASGSEQNFFNITDTCYFGSAVSLIWTGDSSIYTAAGWRNSDQTFFWGFFKIDTSGDIIIYKDITDPLVGIISTAKTFDEKYLSVGIHFNEAINRYVIYAFKLNSDLEYDTIYNTPFVYDSLCPYGITSGTTDLDCDILVMIDDEFIPLNEAKLKIFPNPATDHITISFPDVTHTGQREIIIFNSLGMEVKRISLIKGDEETRVNISELPAGIYFVVMMDKGKRISTSKLVIER